MARKKVPLAAVRKPRNALELVNSKPFPVTDPEDDAPDGAEVDGHVRVGKQWEPVGGPYVRAQYSLTRAQHEVLEDEAIRRRRERGRGKTDAGEVLRDFIDACYAKWVEGQR